MIPNDPQEPQTEAGRANPERGIVILDGPDGVAVSIEPDAAEETGQRLIDAAVAARAQDRDADPS